MGYNTKIDWVDSSWNPVTGCRHGCPYCYANRIASRFSGFEIMDENNAPCEAWFEIEQDSEMYEVTRPMTRKTKDGDLVSAPYPFGFCPTFHQYRLDDPKKWSEPRNIFVCSMADLFGDWVPDSWIQRVFEACDKAPQHRYFFLTKNCFRYPKVIDSYKGNFDNKWFGTTLTNYEDYIFRNGAYKTFLSIEPIQEYLDVKPWATNWVIIGAETGNRVGKVKPEKRWICDIVLSCMNYGVPVFMKESLRELMGDNFIQEYPKEFEK